MSSREATVDSRYGFRLPPVTFDDGLSPILLLLLPLLSFSGVNILSKLSLPASINESKSLNHQPANNALAQYNGQEWKKPRDGTIY